MNKGALTVVLGFLSLCLPLAAQQTEDETIALEQSRADALDTAAALTLYQPDLFRSVDSSILIHGLPVPTLLDGRRLPVSSALARMGTVPLDLFPVALVSAVDVSRVNASPVNGSDSLGEMENLRADRGFYSSGEMGFLYGTTTGKFGYETKQSYIQGTVGNDKFQITAGVSSEESSWRFPRH